MDRTLLLTEDGSHTLFVKELGEPYHSIHGAVQESLHVFINQGYRTLQKPEIRILEMGLGTGLNVLLTLVESMIHGTQVFYHAVEKYPLLISEYQQLNFERFIAGIPAGSLTRLHEAPWNVKFTLTDHFDVLKEQSDFRSMDPSGTFDLVYFDAFSPEKQPELWTPDIFNNLSGLMHPGSILVTYSAKGSVRRALTTNGFEVMKVPGPPGKREMIRAVRR